MLKYIIDIEKSYLVRIWNNIFHRYFFFHLEVDSVYHYEAARKMYWRTSREMQADTLRHLLVSVTLLGSDIVKGMTYSDS